MCILLTGENLRALDSRARKAFFHPLDAGLHNQMCWPAFQERSCHYRAGICCTTVQLAFDRYVCLPAWIGIRVVIDGCTGLEIKIVTRISCLPRSWRSSCRQMGQQFLGIRGQIWRKHVCEHSCNHLVTLQWRHNERGGASNHKPHGCLLSRVFKSRSKKTSKLRVTGLCVGNSPGTGEFPAQMASNPENVSIWWLHHDNQGMRGKSYIPYHDNQCGSHLSVCMPLQITTSVIMCTSSLTDILFDHNESLTSE